MKFVFFYKNWHADTICYSGLVTVPKERHWISGESTKTSYKTSQRNWIYAVLQTSWCVEAHNSGEAKIARIFDWSLQAIITGRENIDHTALLQLGWQLLWYERTYIQAQEVQIATGHSEALLQQQSRVTLELTTVACCRCWYSLDLQEASRCLQRVGHSKLVKLLSPTSTSNK